MKNDEFWMNIALQEAEKAAQENEVPIGACLVKNNELIARNHNRTKQLKNPLAHAEKLVIEEVISKNEIHLNDYTLYVTVEPCVMCSGMIVWSRVGRVVFGSYDEKAGGAGSIYNILKNKSFNHHPTLENGVLNKECSKIISDFFQAKRDTKKLK